MAGDLETAEARLDDAYTASEKDKNMRYVSTCTCGCIPLHPYSLVFWWLHVYMYTVYMYMYIASTL